LKHCSGGGGGGGGTTQQHLQFAEHVDDVVERTVLSGHEEPTVVSNTHMNGDC